MMEYPMCLLFTKRYLSFGGTHRLFPMSSVRTIIRCMRLDVSLALTTQLRPSRLRPGAYTELLQVMRLVLQAHLHWEETVRIVV